jgi:hypothetical protein
MTRGVLAMVLVAGSGVTPAGGVVLAMDPKLLDPFPFLSIRLGWRIGWTANGKCQRATILMSNNKVAYSYLEDSTSCAFRLRTTRRPCGTKGRVPVNSTDGPRELPLLASVSASFSARGLPPSVDSLLGRASATRALFASAATLGEDGVVEECWVAVGRSGTLLCDPAGGSQLAVAEQQNWSSTKM